MSGLRWPAAGEACGSDDSQHGVLSQDGWGCLPQGVPRLVGAARTDPVRPQLRPQDTRGCSDPNRFPRGRGSCEQGPGGVGGWSHCAPWPVHGQRSDQVPEPGVGGEAGIRLLGFTLFFSFLKDYLFESRASIGRTGVPAASAPSSKAAEPTSLPWPERTRLGVGEQRVCGGSRGPPKPQQPQVLACGAATRVCGQEGAWGGAGAGRAEHLSPPPLTCRVGGLVPPGRGKTRGRRPGHGALGPASQEQQGAWGPTAGWEEAPPTDPSGATPLVGEPADPATCLRGQGHRREAERRERGVRCPQGHTLTRRVGCPWGHTCGGVSTGPPPPHLLSHDLSGLLRGV